MSVNAAEVATGAAVLAAAIGFAWYAAQGLGNGRAAGDYELTASFRSAEGVTVGTDVRLAGVKVGTVTRLELNPETFAADATFTVAGTVALPDDSTAIIASEGLLGGAFLELQPGGSLDSIPPGGEVENTQAAVSVIGLLMRFVSGDEEGAAAGGTDGAAP